MKKAALVIPWFGKWPEWIELYLYSCSRNPMVDFIIYTDCILQERWAQYKNVHFVSLSFSEYCQIVGERLGISYAISNPYKLTDLKPFLGKVHEQELAEYDFWGFGDLDLVYEDLTPLVNERMLARYKLLTTHNYHIAGHFTLCRNDAHYRNLCFNVRDWKTRLGDDTHYGFDEAEWSRLVYPKQGLVRRLYDFLKPLGIGFNAYMERANRLLSPQQHFSEYGTTPTPERDQVWLYCPQTGRLTSPLGRELPYLHFLFFKKTPWHKTESYWREGYYRLNASIEEYGQVCISLDGVQSV